MTSNILPWFMATDIKRRMTYIVEPKRRGSKRLQVSVMPADEPIGDTLTTFRHVPHEIRRAAREALQ